MVKARIAAWAVIASVAAGPASATEFYMGEPVVKDGMQLSPAYLTGITMSAMAPGMSRAKDAVHVEIDIHATAKEAHGFPPDAWIPYLGVKLTVAKADGSYSETKTLAPMTAADGPHYANDFAMHGPGTYKATYVVAPPSVNGFLRHVDKATGVPDWWKPITVSWTFDYPAKHS
ncbi:iron transporter [Jiella sonneratiae]|uniref:Iron transporter n=1 Tax=Jiella sonneratiae TaxID=2816856 RepID=A0ABS3J1E1_9HYPH|nr:iron transporter [Jiella sonneratiae]MBO0903468.1 iron transporter [Jiella sonneratiae]